MTTPSERELRIASISDIHVGHPRTPTAHILDNLYKAFPNNESTAKLDVIFIAGDFFDRLLKFPDPDIPEIELWILYMLRMAAQHDIVIRVLEGTPSHDWKQSSVFERINTNANIGCNLKYVSDLRIETIPELDSTILYIPDEWGDSTESSLSQVQELMTAKGLNRVDYAIMHGHFPHQLPEVARTKKVHNTEAYLRLVDKLIFIGHDHHFSVHERIISHGSFDRLGHGEEAPKGHIRAVVKSRDNYRITFVENKGAKIYKTIDVKDWTLEEALINLKDVVESLPLDSAIRIVCKAGSPLASSLDVLAKRWPGIKWDKKVIDSDGSVIEVVNQYDEDEFVPVEITKDNIGPLLMARIVTRAADEKILANAEKFINEIK